MITVQELIDKLLKVEVKQIYENGEVVRCDTNYYKL